MNKKGEISSGDFRADQMEGKLTHQKTLSAVETERIYQMIVSQRDVFIAVDKFKKKTLDSSVKPRRIYLSTKMSQSQAGFGNSMSAQKSLNHKRLIIGGKDGNSVKRLAL